MSRAMTSSASWRTAELKSTPAAYCGTAMMQRLSVVGVEHVLHDAVEVGELALAVVEDIAPVRGGTASGRPFLVDPDVLGDHALEPLPVGAGLLQVLVVSAGIPQLPGLEP